MDNEISLQLPPECRDILADAAKRAHEAKTQREKEDILNEAIEICKRRFPRKFHRDTRNIRKKEIENQNTAMAMAESGASVAEIVSTSGVSRYIAKQMIASVLKAKTGKKNDIRYTVPRQNV